MIKIFHCADLHLDSPLTSLPENQAAAVRRALADLPRQIAAVCRKESCDLLLLAGDIFDRPSGGGSAELLRSCLEEIRIPVFISPGNHDYLQADSPWLRMTWPENVHIFESDHLEAFDLPELDCCIYGAGFHGMDCPPLLEHFHADSPRRWRIGLCHGDPTVLTSPCNPVTASQVQNSNLSYLALGHIHRGGSFQAGDCLCAWPGCPVGRSFDEPGQKGGLLAVLDDTVSVRSIALEGPAFYDLEIPAGNDPEEAVASLLPPVGNDHFYRITLTGPSRPLDPDALKREDFPNLLIRDHTVPESDPWQALEEDSLEGLYFRRLRSAMEGQDDRSRACIELAARISRQLLDGQEVELP